MNKQVAYLFAAAMTLWAGSCGVARAEGNCPPGFYPIGGQGVQGCAPIPGANQSSTPESAPLPPPTPTGRWHNRWGSIAHSMSTSAAGVSTGLTSREEAEKSAMSRCSAEGATDCSVAFSYANQCAAWVVPRTQDGRGKSAIGNAPTLAQALKDAQRKCVDSKGAECQVAYTDCSEGIFEEFQFVASGDYEGLPLPTLCALEGAPDCRILLSDQNQCAARVAPGQRAGGLWRGTRACDNRAVLQAAAACNDSSGQGYDAMYTSRSKPVSRAQ